ncbi:histidine phosphatase family protein [Erwinia sp. S43]|uniref:histidine phosphatase family protein n=1 Tax=unclassified Erwinia TaxID=2622719 RepID=UPI001F188CB4|nr:MULTISPECIES: histidine phosphatase family protein [unclassified Erwinia]MBK0031276.1 histidine phosphatase family protein [Erwinia sp. S43]MCW1873036.1 histidine phosphatase family protein [Erwinia sp. INIA01]
MKIILMRHGKPTFVGAAKVTSREMADWVKQYDISDTGGDIPPQSAIALIEKEPVAISSPLPRAISSLQTLGCEPVLVDEVFKEAELPLYLVPGVRLSPFHWAVVYRLLWLCGLSRQVESLKMAKARAARAAVMLVELARESQRPVLLMGHGIINRLIARELKSLCWQEESQPGKGYWGAGVYSVR